MGDTALPHKTLQQASVNRFRFPPYDKENNAFIIISYVLTPKYATL